MHYTHSTLHTGPVEGGTALTVRGTNLGVTFADIQGSILTVGGQNCIPINENYQPGRLFVCETTGFATSGSQVIALTIGSRVAMVTAAPFMAVSVTLNGVTPSFGPLAGGTLITITGSGLNVGNTEETTVNLIEMGGRNYTCEML